MGSDWSDCHGMVYMTQGFAKDIYDQTEVDIFTADGTWTKRANCKFVEVILVGGGGSGGAGAVYHGPGDHSHGGGGGGSGGYSRGRFAASILGTTETVSVGAGGAAPFGDNTPGLNGGTTSFGSWLRATGGGGGAGSLTPGSAGTGEYPGFAGGYGSNATITENGYPGSSSAIGLTPFSPGSGGGGGSGADATGGTSGGDGGNGAIIQVTPPAKGAGGSAGLNGSSGTSVTTYNALGGGGGGGGGGKESGANGGQGGNGGKYGGGSGGGGGAHDPYQSGGGGQGGAGIAIVISYLGT